MSFLNLQPFDPTLARYHHAYLNNGVAPPIITPNVKGPPTLVPNAKCLAM